MAPSDSDNHSGSVPDPIDVEVGRRLRLRRRIIGWSQSRLANEIGITFQQIQKYERGTNRVSAGRLWRIGHALGVSIDYFFQDLDEVDATRDPLVHPEQAITGRKAEFEDPEKQAETLWLVRLYNSQTPETRERFLDFLNSIALPGGERAPRSRKHAHAVEDELEEDDDIRDPAQVSHQDLDSDGPDPDDPDDTPPTDKP